MVCGGMGGGFTELRLTIVNGMWLLVTLRVLLFHCFHFLSFFSIEIEPISECRGEEILFS
jgi:uncharacterized membrane protein (GlpM family)